MSLSDSIERADAMLPGTPAPDGHDDPRWQALIAIQDHIESSPEPIWKFVAHWGCSPQNDLQDAIGCLLLEHLLEHHFDLIFPRVSELVTADGNFAGTFLRTWKLGQVTVPENSRRFDELQEFCRRRVA